LTNQPLLMECPIDPGEERVKDWLCACSDAAATVDIPIKTWLIFCELIYCLKPHALESGSLNPAEKYGRFCNPT